jgi:phosphate acetyltransferase/phosphate butyryltransferase
MAEELITNVTFDELFIGQTAEWTRTATDTDIQLGALYSGDCNPAHLSDKYAKAGPFKARICHGLWLLGAVSGILGMDLPGLGTIFLNESVSYRKPVYIGDTVTIKLTCASKSEDKPWAKFDVLVTNQSGKAVLTGWAEVLCPTEKLTFPRQVPKVEATPVYQRMTEEEILEGLKTITSTIA